MRISESTPVVIEGTSIETLSVSISNRLSPGFTASPAALNHFVILPSATVSPSCGISTSMGVFSAAALFDPFPDDFVAGRAGWTQDQPVAGKFIAAHHVALVARLDAALLVMGDSAGLFVDRESAEIRDVVGNCSFGLVGRWFLAGLRDFAIGRDMARHVAVNVIHDDALGTCAARAVRLAVNPRANMTPRSDQALPIRWPAHLIRSHVTS